MGDKDDGIQIGHYEDWMFDQVIDMIVAQYGRDRDNEARLFKLFYESPFQRPNGIRLVAREGETVCGFQSYFFWPYMYRGQRLRTFQSGNSLVSPDYRGRRIFARLLNHLEETQDRPPIDFLVGFPVEMSYGSFIRNGWDNPFDLTWMVRLIRPLSIVKAHEPSDADWHLDRSPEPVKALYPDQRFALSQDEDFVSWRREYAGAEAPYRYYHHQVSGKTVRFGLKPNRRGRLNELILGEIVRDDPDPELLSTGLRALVRAVRGHPFVTMLSIALNADSSDPHLLSALRRRGFFRIQKKMYFILKTLGSLEGTTDPQGWDVFRSDVDTW